MQDDQLIYTAVDSAQHVNQPDFRPSTNTTYGTLYPRQQHSNRQYASSLIGAARSMLSAEPGMRISTPCIDPACTSVIMETPSVG